MPTRSWNLTEAKAKFSNVVQRALDGEPQRIVRGGRKNETVLLIREDAYDAATRPTRSLIDIFSVLRGVDIDLERDGDPGREAPTF